MSNLDIEPKDGKIKISISSEAMYAYLDNIAGVSNRMRINSAAAESALAKSFKKYDKSKDYVPFRILDGEFYPYFETFMYPYLTACDAGEKACVPGQPRNALMLKTHVATFMVEKDIPANSLSMEVSMSDRFYIPTIIGANARDVHSQVGNFPKLFWENLPLNKTTEFFVTPHVYQLISISSTKKHERVPMYLDVSESTEELEASIAALRAINATQNNIDSSMLEIIYPLTVSQHTCLSIIGKIKIKLKNSQPDSKKIDAMRITLGPDDANDVVKYLAKPLELKGQINCNADSEFYIQVVIPEELATLVKDRLDLTSPDSKAPDISMQSKVEIMLSRVEFPYIEKDLEKTMGAQIKKFTVAGANDHQIEGQEIISVNDMHAVLTGCPSYYP